MDDKVRKRTHSGFEALQKAQALVEGSASRLKAASERIDETLSEADVRRPKGEPRRGGQG